MSKTVKIIIIAAMIIVSALTYDNFLKVQKAMAEKNPQLCDDIFFRQMKDPCYAAVGIATMNESLCNKPENQDEVNRCLGVVKADETYCRKISSQDTRDYCFYYLTMRTGDAGWCGSIMNQQKSGECMQKAPKQ